MFLDAKKVIVSGELMVTGMNWVFCWSYKPLVTMVALNIYVVVSDKAEN